MARACRAVTAAMDALAPRVVPGVTMNELREEVELQLRRAGSMTPSFPTHVFTGTYAGTEPGDLTSGSPTGDDPLRDGTSVLFDFGGGRRRVLLGLRADSRLWRAERRGGARLRGDARRRRRRVARPRGRAPSPAR